MQQITNGSIQSSNQSDQFMLAQKLQCEAQLVDMV